MNASLPAYESIHKINWRKKKMIKISKDEAKFLRDNGYGRMITVAGGGHGS